MSIPGTLGKLDTLQDVVGCRNYFLFVFEGKSFIFLPEKLHIEPGIITNTIAKILGKPYPATKRSKVTTALIRHFTITRKV